MVSSTLTKRNSGDLLLVHHVARLLGVPCRTVRHWAATGRLPAMRAGRRAWNFRRGDVVAFALLRHDDRRREAVDGDSSAVRAVN